MWRSSHWRPIASRRAGGARRGLVAAPVCRRGPAPALLPWRTIACPGDRASVRLSPGATDAPPARRGGAPRRSSRGARSRVRPFVGAPRLRRWHPIASCVAPVFDCVRPARALARATPFAHLTVVQLLAILVSASWRQHLAGQRERGSRRLLHVSRPILRRTSLTWVTLWRSGSTPRSTGVS